MCACKPGRPTNSEAASRTAFLLLPNAWEWPAREFLKNAGTPRLPRPAQGSPILWAIQNGQRISRGEMLEVVGRIARAVRIPVTADFGSGLWHDRKEMAETVKAAIEAGAIGMNLED